MNKLFESVFAGDAATVAVGDFLLCVGVSLALGLLIAFCYMFRTVVTKSFVVTLALLPAVVSVVIMMVNGNLGAGVAVAGAFSLVRFRSVPGTAKEIGMLFLAMGTGLVTGMGYLAYAALFSLLLCAFFLLCGLFRLGDSREGERRKILRVTIPEDLDYTQVFDEPLSAYTVSHELIKVKTVNMGSMFRLTYEVVLRDPAMEKEFIDRLRERNGNLEITVSRQETVEQKL